MPQLTDDLFDELDIIPPVDQSIIARCEYMVNDEFRNVRVDCIDTSTPRLFVEFSLGVCRNKVKNQRWWQWLAYI